MGHIKKDPLTGDELKVEELSEVWHALKLASETQFAINAIEERITFEIGVMGAESYSQRMAVITPYLPEDTDTSTTDSEVHKINYIPDPLPPKTPSKVRDALDYINAQFETEKERMTAQKLKSTTPLIERLTELKESIGGWFKNEVLNNAAWLGGKKSVKLSACTLEYVGGEVRFKFERMRD